MPRRDYQWIERHPISTYLFGFAAGSFAATASRADGVELEYFGTALSPADLQRAFADMPAMLHFFEARAGVRYRGHTYALVLAAESVEQEVDRFTELGEAYARRLLQDPTDEWLLAHEFAHQWWGNGVTCRTWNDFWLNEGLASFMADAWKEKRFGRAAYLREIELSRTRYERVREAGHDHPLVYESWDHPTASDRVIVYHKGAYVLSLLRDQLGDALFWKGLRAYTRAAMGGAVTTRDFQRAMEGATQRNLSAFFARWVYGAHPN